jgi:dTDP-glucose pyrophosphorylase
MQAVILAAGRGTRMGALTAELPKPMLTVGRKTLLEHKLETLSGICDEVIIVVGYYGDMIRDHLGSEYSGVPIRYVTQEVLDGTGGAIVLARPFLTDRFVVLMGDDLYSRDDVERVCAKSDWALLIEKTEHMGAGGSMTLDANGSVTGIEEGNHRGKQGIMCTNMHLLDARFFTYPMVPKAE